MKKFSEMTKKTTVTGEDYVPIIDSTAPTIEEKNKAALLSTIKSFIEDGFTAGNPELVFGVGSNSDPTGYPRVEFRKTGSGDAQGVSFVYYDANGNATFNDFIRSDGTFIPSKVDKAGDTMTGALKIQATDITIGTLPSANTFSANRVTFEDSTGVRMGYLAPFYRTTDVNGYDISAVRTVSGVDKFNSLKLEVDNSGTPSVRVTSAESWREALSVKGIDNSVSLSGVPVTGYITNGQKRLILSVPYPLFSGTRMTINTLSMVLRHVGGSGYVYLRSGTDGATYTALGSGQTSVIANGAATRTNEVASFSVAVKEDYGVVITINFTYAMCINNTGTVVANNSPVAADITLAGTVS